MSLERFMGVCFPLRKDLHLITRRIKYVIAFTVVFSATFNILVLFRYEITPHFGLPDSYSLTDLPTLRLVGVHSPDDLSPEDPDKSESSALQAKSDSDHYGQYNSATGGAICASGHKCIFLGSHKARRPQNDKIRPLPTPGAVGTGNSKTPTERPSMQASTEAMALPIGGG
ncbi:hypothetical protein RRG08_022489 [Elysia crispata]|uniref:Uncharacterized protein n=1 Tax=Elysia crispata TaxID=231223 RepID=A0AAE1D8W9_9GAST|nr:hypothetical protein RRG08_022489 [Elysia crispata]